MSFLRFVPVVAASTLALVACSSSSTPSDATLCEANFPLSGSVTTQVTGSGLACGDSQGATLFWAEGILGNGPETSVNIQLTTPLTSGQTGSQAATLTVSAQPADGGFSSQWVTPTGACNVTFSSNTSDPDPTGIQPNRYAVQGNGTCAQAAAADPGSGATGTVTIGAFTFSGFIDHT